MKGGGGGGVLARAYFCAGGACICVMRIYGQGARAHVDVRVRVYDPTEAYRKVQSGPQKNSGREKGKKQTDNTNIRRGSRQS